MKLKQKIWIGVLLLTMIFTMPGSALSISNETNLVLDMTCPLIIKMGDGPGIQAATNILKKDVSNARIKEVDSYNELDYAVAVAHADIFYVGHGNEEGLQVGEDTIRWRTFRRKLDDSSAVHHWLLACEGDKVLQAQDRHITAFKGEIDATIAAHLTLMLRQRATGGSEEQISSHFLAAVSRYADIQQGIAHKQSLGYIVNSPFTDGGLGLDEVLYWGLAFLTLFFLCIVPSLTILRLYSTVKFELLMRGVVFFFAVAELGLFLEHVFFVIEGSVDVFAFVFAMLNFFIAALTGLSIKIPQTLDPVEMILCGSAILASVAALLLPSGPAQIIASAAALVAGFAVHAYAFACDLNDENEWVG